MAKIRTGGLAAQISGSIAGNTFSRNRYGAYVRSRACPVNPLTTYQTEARAIMQTVSSTWKGLTATAQESWKTWAQSNPITDTFGEAQILSGQAAYVKLNARVFRQTLNQIATPPTTPAPAPLVLLSCTADIGAGNFELLWNPANLPAGVGLWIWATMVNSAGISFVRNKLKLIHRTPTAPASPTDIQTETTLRFGTLTVGQVLHVSAHTITSATGLISVPLICHATVTTS